MIHKEALSRKSVLAAGLLLSVLLLLAYVFLNAPSPDATDSKAQTKPVEQKSADPLPDTAVAPDVQPVISGTPARARSGVHGTVFDVVGAPAPESRVLLFNSLREKECGSEFGEPFTMETVTDETGAFEFSDVPEGSYRVVATRDDVWGAEQEVLVRENDAGRPVELVLSAKAGISGEVVSDSGAPIAGAFIRATGYEFAGTPGASMAVSDVDGKFSLLPLDIGQWEFYACAPGYQPQTTEWIPAPSAAIRIVMGAERSIRGTVLRASTSEPVPDVQLSVTPKAHRRLTQTFTSDKEGQFLIPNCPAERMVVRVEDEEWSLIDPAGSITVDAASSEEFTVSVESGATVMGTVRDFDGNPLSNSQVRAMGVNFSKLSNNTESDGHYVVGGLPRGTVRLLAMVNGKHLDHVEPQEVMCELGGIVENVDFEVEAGSLEGVVRYTDGKTAPSARVFLTHPSGVTSVESSNEDGRFVFEALDPEADYYVSATEGKNYSVMLGPFVPSTAERLEITLELANSALLTGRVVNDRSMPVAAATVAIMVSEDNVSTSPTMRVRTDAQGNFSAWVSALCTIDFMISTSRFGGDMVPETPPQPASIHFDASKNGQPVILKVAAQEKKGSISGTVIDEDGQPVVDMVTVHASGEHTSLTQGSMTNKKGEFSFTTLEPGTFTLFADSPFGTTVVEGVKTDAKDVVIQLAGPDEANELHGQVIDASTGEPLTQFFLAEKPLMPPGATLAYDAYTPYSGNDGEFIWKRMGRSAQFSFCCRAEGYTHECKTVTIEEGEEAPELVFELQPRAE